MKTRQQAGRRVHADVATPPGEHLADTLRELGMSQADLARKMGRPQPAINQIVRGLKAITAETALQLEEALGVSAETWMALQVNYELTKARLARKGARPAPRARTRCWRARGQTLGPGVIGRCR